MVWISQSSLGKDYRIKLQLINLVFEPKIVSHTWHVTWISIKRSLYGDLVSVDMVTCRNMSNFFSFFQNEFINSIIFWKHFSKTKSNFNDHIRCLQFVSEYLDQVANDNSPVAKILDLERRIDDFRKQNRMPDVTRTTDGSWGHDVTELFVSLYEVRLFRKSTMEFPNLFNYYVII